MGKSAIDANVNTQIFRKDNPIILACRRDLAQISPVRLALDASGYKAGQVLARKSSDGLFYKYSAASGTSAATCVLFENVSADDQPATGAALARAVFTGLVMTDKLLDYSAQAKTDLKSRDYTDASSTNVTLF